MKKILGIISDTHMNKADKELGFFNETLFSDVSEIIHCGDLVSLDILNAFSDKKVTAVSGNMDSTEVRQTYSYIEKKTISGIKFLIVHGDGFNSDIFDSLKKEFPDFNVFLYGHTHKPLIKKTGNSIFFNPGSFSHNRVKKPLRSAGLIEIYDDKLIFKIIEIEDILQNKFKINEVLDVRYSKGNFF